MATLNCSVDARSFRESLDAERIDNALEVCTMEFALIQSRDKDDRMRKVRPVSKSPSGSRTPLKPEWADGLRKLYDSVVHEPLPGSFDDLLKELDLKSAERLKSDEQG